MKQLRLSWPFAAARRPRLPEWRSALRSAELQPWQRSAAYTLLWLALDAALFVPSYVCSQPSAEFWPFFPRGRAWTSARAYLWALLVRRDNLDVFRVSVDLLALLVIATWSARWPVLQRPVRRVLVGFYVLLFVFSFYHQAVATYFARIPALGEDWRLALNLSHLLGSFLSLRRFLILSVVIGVPTLLGMAMACALRRWQLQAARFSLSRSLLLTLACLLPCVAMLGWLGVESDAPVVQLISKRMAYNARASYFEALRLGEIRAHPPDRSYDAYSSVTLLRKPNVYLLMIEAYGEVLATWDMAPAYRALMARAQARLSAAGYHARTAYSVAPVHGGTSWFSISTVHTGMRIDRPTAYDSFLLVGARVPSLTRFFREQGYKTYALAPGNAEHKGLDRHDPYNHEVMVDGPRLRYRGPRYGWGVIPDQYSIGRMRERHLARAPDPHYLFYMAVSTHWSWDGVPAHVPDWHSLNDAPAAQDSDDASWPRFSQASAIGSELRRGYFRSIDYEWRLLVEWLESEPARDSVVLIVGDHQPRLESDVPNGITLNTPVHVLSRDPAFVERFASAGFQPGLYADPGRGAALRHEGLFSLWVSKLTAAYGTPDAAAVPYRPRGIGLSGLNR